MNSIQKTLTFLETVVNSPAGLRLKDIAPVLGISVPAIHKYAKNFIEKGYIIKDKETGRFKTTFKVVQLGFTVLKSNQVIDITTPLLNSLSSELKSSVHLAIRANNLGLCINKAGSNLTHSSISQVGMEFDLYPTALGRAMLAYLPQEEIDAYFDEVELKSFTQKTVSSQKELIEILQQVKRQGYSTDFEEHKLGLCSIGVPLFDPFTKVIGSISTVVPFSLGQKEEKQTSTILKHYSAELTKVLGEIPLSEFF